MIYGVLLTFVIGYLITILLLPEITNRLLKISISFATGIVINSVLTFMIICFQLPKQEIIIPIVEILLAAGLLIYIKMCGITVSYEKDKRNILLKTAFWIVFIIAFMLLLLHFFKDCHGSWDGIFIWNFHCFLRGVINQVLIGENIIVGKIPSTYLNTDNLTNALNLIP